MSGRLPEPDRQGAVIAAATVPWTLSGTLLATSLAVYVGRRGSPLAVSLLYTAFAGGVIVFAPLWGAVADVTGRRRGVLLVAATGAGLSVPLLVFGDGVGVPLGVRALHAAFFAGFLPVLTSLVSERGGDEGRGRALGTYNAYIAAGAAAGTVSAGVLLEVLAPVELYLCITAAIAVAGGSVLAIEDPADTPQRSPSPRALAGELRERLLPGPEERAHLREDGLRWLLVAVGLRQMTTFGLLSVLPVYFTGPLGLTEATMGAVVALNPALQTPLMHWLGGVADRVGRKPLIGVGIAGEGLFALVVAAAAFTAGTGVLLVAGLAMVLAAAGFSGMWVGTVSFVGDAAPRNREGELMGLLQTARNLGGVAGPATVGALATVAGYPVAFVVAGLFAFGAALLVGVAVGETYPTTS
jgi:MFS family permease